MSDADGLIAKALGIEVTRVTDDLHYQSVREWDSLGHVALMVELEAALKRPIDDDLMLSLRTASAVREFVAGETVPAAPAGLPSQPIRRGLEGVVFDHSAITRIDGDNGRLYYRGYSIHDLAGQVSFEEVSYLLIHGDLPGVEALSDFTSALAAARVIPTPVIDIARSLALAHPMEALRTCVSALAAFDHETGATAESPAEAYRSGLALIARVPMLVALHHAFRRGREPIEVAPDCGYAEALLTALMGREPAPADIALVDKALVVHADHGSNASTFTTRVVTGCQASVTAAVTAALAAFSGSVHGGAAEGVMSLLDTVGTPENAADYVRKLHERNEPVMGFGHRVYRTEDPRLRHLRASVLDLSRRTGDSRGLDTLDAIVAAMQPYARHGVAPNVDLYAGLANRLMGLPDDLAVPMFAIGRTTGWVAHALEQRSNNVLIRPLLDYTGPQPRLVPDLGDRK